MKSAADHLYVLLGHIDSCGVQCTYVPVQRQNMHGGQMAPDMMVAIPVPTWEALVVAAQEAEIDQREGRE